MRFSVLATLLIASAASPAAAQNAAPASAPVRLELNRLEPTDAGCRVYLVVGNGRPEPVESLRLDIVLFGRDGVVGRRLAVEAGPLRASRTAVKLFDVPGYRCEELGSLLLNDVLACGSPVPAGGTPPDCMAGIEFATRVPGVDFR